VKFEKSDGRAANRICYEENLEKIM